MLGDIGDIFLRVLCVPCRLAIVVHIRTRHQVAVAIHKLIIGQVAGHAHANLVAEQQQRRQLVRTDIGDRQHVAQRIVAEVDYLTRFNIEGYIGAVLLTAGAIILFPAFVDGHFGFVSSRRDLAR